jgi:hypothetical protein
MTLLIVSGVVLARGVIVLTLYLKGDVTAVLKVPFFLDFSLEAKDKKGKKG